MELEAMIRRATEIAQQQGFISFDQINDICPKHVEAWQIGLLVAALRNVGVEVRDEAAPSSPLACSFCGKSHTEVVQLIVGATGLICNECIQLCVGVIARDHPRLTAGPRCNPADACDAARAWCAAKRHHLRQQGVGRRSSFASQPGSRSTTAASTMPAA
jgi:ClpX C4-type zinc finger